MAWKSGKTILQLPINLGKLLHISDHTIGQRTARRKKPVNRPLGNNYYQGFHPAMITFSRISKIYVFSIGCWLHRGESEALIGQMKHNGFTIYRGHFPISYAYTSVHLPYGSLFASSYYSNKSSTTSKRIVGTIMENIQQEN